MEMVLDVYKQHYSSDYPVVCVDESPKQLIKETREPIPGKPGSLRKYDFEYERCGNCNVFLANEPLAGTLYVEIKARKTKKDWALFIENIERQYKSAKKIILVMDNLNTHKPGSFYEVFKPEKAKRLLDRFEFVYTPKHGSWLNMAEIELNVINGQCLNRRIDNIDEVSQEAKAWQDYRNKLKAVIDWQFTTADARIKLKKIYPSFQT
jgi:hypothetical protein